MLNVKQKILEDLKRAIKFLTGEDIVPMLEYPKDERHGDYSTNIALAIFASAKRKAQSSKFRTPMELAQEIVGKFKVQSSKFKVLEKVEAVAPGFINFWLSKDYLATLMIRTCLADRRVIRAKDEYGRSKLLAEKKIMVEFAHPNTHKEMHIGHMRTLITGEALARIFEGDGAKVFRANYQGDIGPHVAKAMYGIQRLMHDESKKRGISFDTVFGEKKQQNNKDKAYFLGLGYIEGVKLYESGEFKKEIDETNAFLYQKVSGDKIKSSFTRQEQDKLWSLYNETRQWSLAYYDELYRRFYTKFDKLFFESEMVSRGKEIVEAKLGTVFRKDQGALVFKGEPYGLHTRVFITQAGYPTYEGKEMANAFEEYEAFAFDKKIHVVASEQTEYFRVVFKALELIDPKKFKDRQYHIPMGMVNLASGKMSSRTGDVLTVDSLIDQVKEKVNNLVKSGKIKKTGTEDVAEEVAIGAIKYSVLKVDAKQDVAFDIEKSVSLDGNSGTYLQYTFARTQSVLAKRKAQSEKRKAKNDRKLEIRNLKLEIEEILLLRAIYRFPEVVEEAAGGFAPNIVCNYLFDLAQKFNLFYQRIPVLHPVIQSATKDPMGLKRDSSQAKPDQNDKTRMFRLALTASVGQVIKNGLYLLGIQAPERM